MNIYAIKEIRSGKFVQISLAESDDTFVRSALFPLLMDFPIKDVEFYCIGQFDNDLGIIKPCVPRLGDWECYKFPTSSMDRENFLTLEQIEELAKNKKHEFLTKSSEEKKQYEKYLSELNGKLNLEESKKEKDKTKIKNLKTSIKEVRIRIQQLEKMEVKYNG